MASRDAITVLVAAFQAAATVRRCVASVLRQGEVGELVVVDDASRDDTVEQARAADDGSGRLRIIRFDANRGPSAARNAALVASSAPLVCVVDADDWVQDGRFAKMLTAPAGWDLLADDLLTADESDPLSPGPPLLGVETATSVSGPDFVTSNISRPDRPRRELGYLKPLVRRELLVREGLGYDETLRLGEDYALYADALIAGARFQLIPACGYVAVRRAGSLSHSHGAAELATLAEADARLVGKAQARAPLMVAPLRAHARATRMKRDLRRMLDAKAQGDWGGVVAHGCRTPATAAYVAAELWRAKRQVRR